MNILEKIMVEGVKGAMGETCTIGVVYGVTEEEFKLYQLTLSGVEGKCRKWSEKVSDGKTNTATKPETS